MPLFQTRSKKLLQVPVHLEHFKNEAALRDFFAENLYDLLGLKFLGNEYPTKDGRIDTIAIDETGTPVVIEYKWSEKDTILTQGLFYIDWLKENKRLFELLVSDKLGKGYKVSWDSPRLLLIAQGFDRYTLSAVRQVKNSVELIKYTPYGSEILFLETVYSPDTVKPRTEAKAKQDERSFGVDYHLGRVDETTKEVFYALEERILGLANVEEKADQKVGITYRTTKSFARFEFGKSYIDVLLREAKYDDNPKNPVLDISSFGWGYKGHIKIRSLDDVEYIFNLIYQSYSSTL